MPPDRSRLQLTPACPHGPHGLGHILVRSEGRQQKDRAIRRRRLKRLWQRLKAPQAQELTRDELLLKLAAARAEAGRTYRLIEIRVPTADLSIFSALGTTVVYDSHVHGSWRRIRDLTTQNHGKPPALSEEDWIRFYVSERRNWLATNTNVALHATVYRMDTFNQLMVTQNWGLALPITVRGVRVDQEILMAEEPARVSASDASERTLLFQTPFMVGDDVEAVQRALVQAGISVDVDGIYGRLTVYRSGEPMCRPRH